MRKGRVGRTLDSLHTEGGRIQEEEKVFSLLGRGGGEEEERSQERQSAVEGRKEGRSHCTVCCSHRRDLGQNAELTQCVPSPRTNKSKTEKRLRRWRRSR